MKTEITASKYGLFYNTADGVTLMCVEAVNSLLGSAPQEIKLTLSNQKVVGFCVAIYNSEDYASLSANLTKKFADEDWMAINKKVFIWNPINGALEQLNVKYGQKFWWKLE